MKSKDYKKGWKDAVKAIRLFCKEEMKVCKAEEKRYTKSGLLFSALEQSLNKETYDFMMTMLETDFADPEDF